MPPPGILSISLDGHRHDLCRTAITLQYGPDLARERVVHLEVLCPASEKMTTLFNESKPLMIKYRQASTLLEKINRFLEDTVPDDMDEHHTKQVCTQSLT